MSGLFFVFFYHSFKLFPQIVVWHRRHNFDKLFGDRVHKLYAPGVQADAAVAVGARKAVFEVAFDRAANFGKLAPYLMMTAGF